MRDIEKIFYNELEKVFIGLEIDGKGGFVNLMKIKSKYYKKIEPYIKKDIDKILKKYPDFGDELFTKLYNFFHMYFSENGSIHFNSTVFHNNVYEKVYDDNKDATYFWKTRGMYYVKTDKIIKSMQIKIDDKTFYFDVSNLEYKKANERKTLIYNLKSVENGIINLDVNYSDHGRTTKIENIVKTLKKDHNISINEDVIEKAIRNFEKQSEVDFFIHKNAKEFLREQFKLWIYHYFWNTKAEWSEERVNQLNSIKDIAYKIIDFVSQFEDELVKIWNKPKFVKNSNYVITLDRIPDFSMIEKILSHPNIKDQIKEWKELEMIKEKDFDVSEIIVLDKQNNKTLNKKYATLTIDTKYFKDLEPELLSLFDNLDDQIDGYLIKSENYQAMNTILPKFRNRIQTIFIDPPFNLDSSDQFMYRTNYKDANWATLLENRIVLAKELLNDKGSMFVRCDYNGNYIVRQIMDDIFGRDNFKNEIVIKRGSIKSFSDQRLPVRVESVFFYSKSKNSSFKVLKVDNESYSHYKELLNIIKRNVDDKVLFEKIKSNMEEDLWQDTMVLPGRNKEPRYFFGVEIKPPDGMRWTMSQETINEKIKTGTARIKCYNCGNIITDKSGLNGSRCGKCGSENIFPQFIINSNDIDNNWTDINGYAYTGRFSTENSEVLLKRVLDMSSENGDFVMDFFSGSGTTIATAHKMGRKWIGIELGEHFYTVDLPRMKKVLFYDSTGVGKEIKEYKGGGFFKYYELEQYEETLARCEYTDSDMLNNPSIDVYNRYVFATDKKLLEKALKIDNYKVKVLLDNLYDNIDIVETISNLTGKKVKKILGDKFILEDETEFDKNDIDYRIIKPLIWWE